MKILNEKFVEEKAVPGRYLRWIVTRNDNLTSDLCSCCIMRVEAGQTVKPAHVHPAGEELIYVIEGRGEVYVDGLIRELSEGTAVLFEKGSVHIVRNSGDTEMKVICFYAPATSFDEYEFHPEIEFDSGVRQPEYK